MLKYELNPKSKLYVDAEENCLKTITQIDWSKTNPVKDAEIELINNMINELEKILSNLKKLRLNYKREVR